MRDAPWVEMSMLKGTDYTEQWYHIGYPDEYEEEDENYDDDEVLD